MNPILNLTYPLSGIFIFALAIGLGISLTRKFNLSWRLYWIGAATFLLSQVGHIPFNAFLTSLFRNNILPIPPESWQLSVQVIVLGLSAGLFEESARYAIYRWWAKDARSWSQGLLFGAGHGGLEAILVGSLILITFLNMFALRGADLPSIVSPERVPQLQSQLGAYWSVAWYDSLLGAVERAFSLPAQLALAVMVLQVFLRRQLRWLALAIGWHTFLNATVLYAAAAWNIYIAEGLLGLLAAANVGIILFLRQSGPESGMEAPGEPTQPGLELHPRLKPVEETSESLDRSRFTDE